MTPREISNHIITVLVEAQQCDNDGDKWLHAYRELTRLSIALLGPEMRASHAETLHRLTEENDKETIRQMKCGLCLQAICDCDNRRYL